MAKWTEVSNKKFGVNSRFHLQHVRAGKQHMEQWKASEIEAGQVPCQHANGRGTSGRNGRVELELSRSHLMGNRSGIPAVAPHCVGTHTYQRAPALGWHFASH